MNLTQWIKQRISQMEVKKQFYKNNPQRFNQYVSIGGQLTTLKQSLDFLNTHSHHCPIPYHIPPHSIPYRFTAVSPNK